MPPLLRASIPWLPERIDKWSTPLVLAGSCGLVLLGFHRVRNFRKSVSAEFGESSQGEGALRGLTLMSATKGVDESYSPAPRAEWWWLQGKRLDTAALFDHLGEAGIRELSTAFYQRVYADEEVWFRDLFKRRATLQQSIDRQVAFFAQHWGDPTKPYTATNQQHCLRSLVGDLAGAKMVVMHDSARASGHINDRGAARWWFHMDAALLDLRPVWRATYGEDVGCALEKTVRWFCDHVLERLVWGGPVKSPLAPQRLMFKLVTAITRRFVCHLVALPRSVAATILQLPPHVVEYKRLPEDGTFTVATMPRGLLSRHNTKADVWGAIHVVKGRLQLNQLEGEVEEVVLTPTSGIGVVAPSQYHQVKPLTDDMEMFIRFCAKPGTGPLAAGASEQPRGPGLG
eukprot:TRINITY_DN41944_c0_g1_i1.p1 TRINITY_DN41944_c0_g1~~TRINITY_DN41944_c0_g1_i1.p1  ORF type:complete len:400 (-),score=61.36 TRINITY_DN41944_c0_g1_i1:351-1550(-)